MKSFYFRPSLFRTFLLRRADALLRGLLYAPLGERMYPIYSRKNGCKYHCYVSKSESRFVGRQARATNACPHWRLRWLWWPISAPC